MTRGNECMMINRRIVTNQGSHIYFLNGFVTLGNPQKVSHSGCNYSLKCYWGDYEDEYRLKKAGKDCLFQDVILQCVRRSMKKKLESVTLLELRKDVR